jgi:NTP pyrophosphatase (non-canonical NTP hydrolase)
MGPVTGIDEYAARAISTMVGQDELTLPAELAGMLNAVMGMAGESGEALDLLKKVIFHGHPLDEETLTKLDKEVGDVGWYRAQYAHYRGTLLSAINQQNLDKLAARYASGKFTTAESLDRAAG